MSRTTTTTTQVITRYFGRWPQTKIQPRITTTGVIPRSLAADNNITFLGTSPEKKDFKRLEIDITHVLERKGRRKDAF